jgi:hypothetical protein
VGKFEGRRPHERPKRRWNDNIKMGHQEVVGRDMKWICVAQDWDSLQAAVNVLKVQMCSW